MDARREKQGCVTLREDDSQMVALMSYGQSGDLHEMVVDREDTTSPG